MQLFGFLKMLNISITWWSRSISQMELS